MNNKNLARKAGWAGKAGRVLFVVLACLLHSRLTVVRAADDPRQIVAEAQKRTDVKSQRYEGLLQVLARHRDG